MLINSTPIHAAKHGLKTEWIKVDGNLRRYLIYKPKGIQKKRKKERTLVFVIHGGGGTDQGMVKLTKQRWNQLADLHQFYVVYPNAMERSWDFSEGPTSEKRRVRVNDLNYFSAVLDNVILNHNIDASRVFATGHSRGGMASYFLGCHLNGKIRAIAPVSMPLPTFLTDDCERGLPLGVAIFNGTKDPQVPYHGGWSRVLGIKREELLSTSDTTKLFRQRNGCSPIPSNNRRIDKPGDQTSVQKTVWGQCFGADIALYRIENGGHTWPSGQQYLGEKLIGKTSRDINAADEAWQFFNSFKPKKVTVYANPGDLTVDYKAGLNERVLLPEFPDRPYDIFIPEKLDSKTKAPVLLLLHDQDADALNALRMTCSNGRKNDPSCITALANREGFVVVMPRGTPRLLAHWQRSWNAGGGDPDQQWQCSYGRPCQQQANDIEYLLKTMQHVQTKVLIDHRRVYAAGLGNGAAMSHRLACQAPNRIAAIEAIGGGNQASLVQGCRPGRAVPVLQIHGSADCIWPMAGGSSCVKGKQAKGKLASFDHSTQTWAKINGCGEVSETSLDQDPKITQLKWANCQQPIAAYRIEQAGHYWPNGFKRKTWNKKSTAPGTVNNTLSNQDIWQFLSAHSIPIQ